MKKLLTLLGAALATGALWSAASFAQNARLVDAGNVPWSSSSCTYSNVSVSSSGVITITCSGGQGGGGTWSCTLTADQNVTTLPVGGSQVLTANCTSGITYTQYTFHATRASDGVDISNLAISGTSGNRVGTTALQQNTDFTVTVRDSNNTSFTTAPLRLLVGTQAASPSCSNTTASAVANTTATINITSACNSATTGATWTAQGNAPTIGPGLTLSTSAFTTAGTYTYTVVPTGTGGATGSPFTVTVTVTAAGGGSGGIDLSLCNALPEAATRAVLTKTDFNPQGTNTRVTDYMSTGMNSNAQGFAPIVVLALRWDTPVTNIAGSITTSESPSGITSTKQISISERPCDFTLKSAGGTALYTSAAGGGVSLGYYVMPAGNTAASIPAFGARLVAGQTFYYTIRSWVPQTNTSSCPAGFNCGVVVDFSPGQ